MSASPDPGQEGVTRPVPPAGGLPGAESCTTASRCVQLGSWAGAFVGEHGLFISAIVISAIADSQGTLRWGPPSAGHRAFRQRPPHFSRKPRLHRLSSWCLRSTARCTCRPAGVTVIANLRGDPNPPNPPAVALTSRGGH